MAGNLFVLPKQIPLNSGVVVPGAKATFSKTGTSTLQNTFTDILLATPHANPVVADSDGVFAPIYFDPTFVDYRLKLTDSSDVLIYQEDDVPSASQTGQDLTVNSAAPFIDLIESDAAANNAVWRLQANSEQLLLRLGNDALSSFVDIVTIDRTLNVVDGVAWVGTHTFNTIGTPDIKFKTADESVTSSTTLQDDNHMVGFTLVTGARYVLEGWLFYTQNVGDLKFFFQFTNAPISTFGFMYSASDSAQTTKHDAGAITFTPQISALLDGSAVIGVSIRGSIKANASTGGTMDFQWAQGISDSNATTLREGSWISLRRIS